MSTHGLNNDLPLLTSAMGDHNQNYSQQFVYDNHNNAQQSTAQQLLHMYNSTGGQRVNSNRHQQNTEQSEMVTLTNPEINNEHTVNTISSVINVCNDIDKEEHCFATESLIKRCIRQHIWPHQKFISDLTIKNMNIHDKTNQNTILNKLINFTRRHNMSDLHRYRFWKKYGNIVKKELNSMKTICTRGIRDLVLSGT